MDWILAPTRSGWPSIASTANTLARIPVDPSHPRRSGPLLSPWRLGVGTHGWKKGELDPCVACFTSSSHVFFCCPADAPHFTSITVFPAGEVTEGGSVTLTCSSDAAPPAESFAWFKGMVVVFCRNGSSASINTRFHVQCAFYWPVMWTISLHVSISALQIWTVAASQTVSDLSSTCPVSNTPTGESTSV